MRFVRFVCLFVIVISMLLLAQNRSSVINQPNALPITQQRHLSPRQNLSQMPPEATTLSQRGTNRTTAAVRVSGSSPASGLSFANAVGYGSGGNWADSVAVADVNGDGKPDLVVANYCASGSCANGTVGVLLGNGDGTFQSAVTYGSGGTDAYSVAVADVNGDGKPDLLVANRCNA